MNYIKINEEGRTWFACRCKDSLFMNPVYKAKKDKVYYIAKADTEGSVIIKGSFYDMDSFGCYTETRFECEASRIRDNFEYILQ